MVLKRPSSVGAAPPSSDKDVELMEHLVQKSLAINPSLRGAKSTGEVLEDLRKQAVTRSKSAPPTPEPPTPKVDLAERRRSTITFFFEQKAQEFKEAARELVAREQQLQKEKQGLKAKVVEELADFLVLVEPTRNDLAYMGHNSNWWASFFVWSFAWFASNTIPDETWESRIGFKFTIIDARSGEALYCRNVDSKAALPFLAPNRERLLEYDIARAVRTRLTFDPRDEWRAVWSPDSKTLAFASDLQRRGLVPADANGALVSALFLSGDAAMVIQGPWFLADAARSGIPFAISPLPVVSETGLPARPFLTIDTAYLSARSRRPAEALALMRDLAGPDGATIRALRGRQPVTAREAYDDPRIAGDPALAAFRDQLGRAVPMPSDPEMRALWEPAAFALRSTLRGDLDPVTALAQAERKFEIFTRPPPPPADPLPFVLGVGALTLLHRLRIRWLERREASPGVALLQEGK